MLQVVELNLSNKLTIFQLNKKKQKMIIDVSNLKRKIIIITEDKNIFKKK